MVFGRCDSFEMRRRDELVACLPCKPVSQQVMPRDRNYQGFVKALDELLGSNRNGDGIDMALKDFRDDDVCKMCLVGLCPYTLFSNTREDMGTCPKIHHEKLNQSYDKVKETQNFGFEEDLEHYLADFIAKCERANETRRRRRIADGIDSQDPAELAKETELAAIIMRNSNLMRDLMEETEKLAEAGDLDASMEAMSKIETLRSERAAAQAEAKRMEEEKRATNPESKLRMCEQCGAFLSIYDNETRLADHFMGKLHIGYVKIREMHAKLAAARRAGDKREDMRGRSRESRLEERPVDRERSDRDRSDRDRVDRDRIDRDRTDRDRVDRDSRGDRDRGDSYRNDRDRDRGGDRDRGRDSYSRDSHSRGGPSAPPPLQQFTFAPPPMRGGDDRDRDRVRDVRPR
jgi:RNA-binding protein Luc7-like 2